MKMKIYKYIQNYKMKIKKNMIQNLKINILKYMKYNKI